jgi:PAS domain S-box-containing protein
MQEPVSAMTLDESRAPGGPVEGRLRVLLVDDVEENLELLQEVLGEQGFSTLVAHNGIDALAMLRRETVQVIVADAMMPKMDGFLLCKEVRSTPAWARLPFVIYTANYVDSADQEFARSIGVDRYVVKYAGLDALVQAVNDLARQRYGKSHVAEAPVTKKAQLDDHAFLEKHRALLIKKLEEKMEELERYAETLEQKNREIQASEERYRRLFEHASVAIYVVDRTTHRIVGANAQGIFLLGSTREELLALPSLPFAQDDEFSRSIYDADSFVSGETTLRRADGELRHVDLGVGPMTGPDAHQAILYVRDITEQRRMRDQLFQSEKLALMGKLAAGIAHEIRNPLSAVSLNLQYLLQKLGDLSALQTSAMDALEGARRIETVIDNTLSLARMSPPQLKEEHLRGIVEAVAGFLKMSLQHKRVKIDLKLQDGLPPVLADAKQIQQVVLNIAQNAIDASPEEATVTMTTGVENDEVFIAVEDEGPGIPPERLERILEGFQTTKAGGTGLGLALSRQIMERHQGRLDIRPRSDRGTSVCILFPVHQSL